MLHFILQLYCSSLCLFWGYNIERSMASGSFLVMLSFGEKLPVTALHVLQHSDKEALNYFKLWGLPSGCKFIKPGRFCQLDVYSNLSKSNFL